MAGLEVASMEQESPTVDEPYHLLAGYELLKAGRIPAYQQHPPLAEVVAALPLLPMNLRLPVVGDATNEDRKRQEFEFLYQNVRPAEEILRAGRMTCIVLTCVLGLLMACWTRRQFGDLAALASLTLFVFDPNFLAHGHYTTSDVPIALAFLGVCLVWNWYLGRPSTARAALAGLFFGAAFGTKYNAIALIPALVALYQVHWWQQDPKARLALRRSLLRLGGALAVMAVVGFAFLFVLFGCRVGGLLPPDPATGRHATLSELLREHPSSGGALRKLLEHPGAASAIDTAVDAIPLPAPAMFQELYYMSKRAADGHTGYLLGEVSQNGWWYYFPVVLAVKTPIGELLLLVLVLFAAVGSLRGCSRTGINLRSLAGRLRGLDFRYYLLAIPPLVYFAICLRSRIDIGVRHILLIYPFLLVLASAVLLATGNRAQRLLRIAAVSCIVLTIAESAKAYPASISFFNFACGGPRRGSDYLVDSNLDWGQDVKRLGAFVARHGQRPVCMAVLGDAPPEYYGMRRSPFPETVAQARDTGCLVVVSLTTLKESNLDGRFNWLRLMPPPTLVGTSLLVYDPLAH